LHGQRIVIGYEVDFPIGRAACAKACPASPSVTKNPGFGKINFECFNPSDPPNRRISQAKLSTCQAAVS
jgi:hypothetical protein